MTLETKGSFGQRKGHTLRLNGVDVSRPSGQTGGKRQTIADPGTQCFVKLVWTRAMQRTNRESGVLGGSS